MNAEYFITGILTGSIFSDEIQPKTPKLWKNVRHRKFLVFFVRQNLDKNFIRQCFQNRRRWRAQTQWFRWKFCSLFSECLILLYGEKKASKTNTENTTFNHVTLLSSNNCVLWLNEQFELFFLCINIVTVNVLIKSFYLFFFCCFSRHVFTKTLMFFFLFIFCFDFLCLFGFLMMKLCCIYIIGSFDRNMRFPQICNDKKK